MSWQDEIYENKLRDERLNDAAPGMLEALQKIHAWWTNMPSFYEGEDEMPADVFDAMRHAIARATHGTNDDGE